MLARTTLAVAVLVAAITAGVAVANTSGRAAPSCGVERWTVKTLQDRPRLIPVRDATIAFLVGRPAPSSLPETRLPFE